MKAMTRLLLLAGVGAALAAAAVGVAQAGGEPRVDIWMDRGDGSIYRPGDCARIHVRPYDDCYVMIYEIDTDGYLRVLFPRDCYEDGYLRGGNTYLLGGQRKLYVTGPTGVGYIHVLASYEPFRQVYWDGCDGYSDYALEVTWRGFHDYWGSALPPRVYGDPYIAMETIDEFICRDALEAGLVWADFTYYYVGARVDYPRYLCYDCHGFAGHVRPYSDVCLGFSISFVDCDPCWRPSSWWWWCSPRRVYCGPRYVCHATEHYCSKKSGNKCDTTCDTYPSEYKWKSRHESPGSAGRATVVERFRAEDASRQAEARGNVIDATRFKSSESRVPAGERSLYSAGEAKKRDVGAADARADNARAEKAKAANGDRNREQVKADNGERKREEVRVEPRGERTKSQSDTSIARKALSSIAKSITRSKKSSTDDEPKGKTPQVRQQGDKGKSQATRRKVSR